MSGINKAELYDQVMKLVDLDEKEKKLFYQFLINELKTIDYQSTLRGYNRLPSRFGTKDDSPVGCLN